MAGFLDKDTRVLDMVLTSRGKHLLSVGDLHFCYWIPFDDEIDYDPFVSEDIVDGVSGTLSEDAYERRSVELIESTPVREATTGYRVYNRAGLDYTNVHMPMFTMAQGQRHLPRAVFPETTTRTINTKQRKVQSVTEQNNEHIPPVDVGVERFESSKFSLEFSYSNDSFPNDFQPAGFRVCVLKSGSSGFSSLDPKRDASNDLCYSNDVRVHTGQGGGQ